MQPEASPEAASQPARVVDDIHDLLDIVSLANVYLWEERGRRIDATGADDDREPRVRNVLNVAARTDQLGIAFRFRMIFDDRHGDEFVADFQAQYEADEPFEVTDAVQLEFAERVAFFTVYPYQRASIQMTASRMGAPAPVLAIIRAGEFKLGSQMTDEAADREFNNLTPES